MGYRTLVVAFLSLHFVHRISGVDDSHILTTFQTSRAPTSGELHYKTSPGHSNTDVTPDTSYTFPTKVKSIGSKSGSDDLPTNSGRSNTVVNEVKPLPNNGENEDGQQSLPVDYAFRNVFMEQDMPDDRIYKGDTPNTGSRNHIDTNFRGGFRRLPLTTFRHLKFNDSFMGFPLKISWSNTGSHISDSAGTKSNSDYSDVLDNFRQASQRKRYLDGVGSSLIKKESIEPAKRYLDGVASALIKKDSIGTEKRYLDGVGSALIKKNIQRNEKRYLDGVASALIKKDSLGTEKRYLDGVGSALIKKNIQGNKKRYLDGVGSALIKKNIQGNEKRYLDGVGSALIKKDSIGTEKRYLDGVGSALIKKNSLGTEKRYLDGVASALIKKNIQGNEKRYLDGVASALIKKDSLGTEKRYLDGVGSALIKKDSIGTQKRYLDGVASALIKKNIQGNEKRYLDGVGSALIKKDNLGTEKRYLDGVGSALIKKDTLGTDKRYLDGVASALIKKNIQGTEKRYLDGVGSALIKKDSIGTQKRYLDGVGSALIKKNIQGNEKRYLDGVGSSLIKKDSLGTEKRYLDGVGSALIKKNNKFLTQDHLSGISKRSVKGTFNDKPDTVGIRQDFIGHLTSYQDAQHSSPIRRKKRYLDGVGSSLIKKESLSNAKRYLDGVGSSLIKKESFPNEKRYLDGVGSSLIKKESHLNEKRYLDGVGSSLIKKESHLNEKRYLDGVGSSLIKKESFPNEKRYLDGVGSSLIKKESHLNEKRYLDGVGSSLIKKDSFPNEKRYLDGVGSSLIKKESHLNEKRYLDGVGSSLIKKDSFPNEKRYLDGVGSSLIKKRFNGAPKRSIDIEDLVKDVYNHNYFGGLTGSFMRNYLENRQNYKRYLDDVASSLVKKRIPGNSNMHLEKWLLDNLVGYYNKRYMDDVASSLIKKDISSDDKRYMDNVASSLIKKNILSNDKRYLDSVASSLIKKDISSDDKRYMDNVASSLIKKDISSDDKRYIDNVASSLIKKDILSGDKRYLDGVASSLIKKKKRYLDGVARSLIRKKSRMHEKRYLDHVANSLFKRGYHLLSSDLLAGGHHQHGRLNEFVMSLLERTQQQARQRYGDNGVNGLVRGDGHVAGEIGDLNSGALIRRSVPTSSTGTEKRASEVVDDVYNVPMESKTLATDPGQEPKSTSRKRRTLNKADDVMFAHEQLHRDLHRVRRFAGNSPYSPDSTVLDNQSQGHSQHFQSHDNGKWRNEETDALHIQDPEGKFEDFLDDGENPTGDKPDAGAHSTLLQENMGNSEMEERYLPFPDVDSKVAQNMAVPTKRFRVSVIRRHPRTRNRHVSFRQYIGSVPGGLAYKRHEYDPDIKSRLPGYPRISLQTRLRALKARGGSDQNALHRFGHKTPKGKKLSEGSFSYPTSQGRQSNRMSNGLLPGRSPPPVQSRNFLKATMGGFGRTHGQPDKSRTRFSPASQRFPNLPKPNQLRPQKSNTNFFEFDSLAGNLIT